MRNCPIRDIMLNNSYKTRKVINKSFILESKGAGVPVFGFGTNPVYTIPHNTQHTIKLIVKYKLKEVDRC